MAEIVNFEDPAHPCVLEPGNWTSPGPCWIPFDDSRANTTKTGRPLVRCACGVLLGLNGHSITAKGKVWPSLLHKKNSALPYSGCGWHAYIVLADYQGGVWDAGK